MLRTAVFLALLCLALGARIRRSDDSLPEKIDSDEDVKRIFRLMVRRAKEMETGLRTGAPMALNALKSDDPEGEMEKMIEEIDKGYEAGAKVWFEILHALDMLAEGIFNNLPAFKRAEGGCDSLLTLSQNMDGLSESDAALQAAMALEADMHCMANDFKKAEDFDPEAYSTAGMTADSALSIVEGISRQMVKTHEDGFKVYLGSSAVLERLNPKLKQKLDEALSTVEATREEKITRMLRTLLNEINRRKA